MLCCICSGFTGNLDMLCWICLGSTGNLAMLCWIYLGFIEHLAMLCWQFPKSRPCQSVDRNMQRFGERVLSLCHTSRRLGWRGLSVITRGVVKQSTYIFRSICTAFMHLLHQGKPTASDAVTQGAVSIRRRHLPSAVLCTAAAHASSISTIARSNGCS